MSLWVVELKHLGFDEWHPVLKFPFIPGVYLAREDAEEASVGMADNVEYYTPGVGGQYRVVKYVRSEGE